eukprot:8834143-Alexandrium_andersonii.AAC.1
MVPPVRNAGRASWGVGWDGWQPPWCVQGHAPSSFGRAGNCSESHCGCSAVLQTAPNCSKQFQQLCSQSACLLEPKLRR